MLQVLYFGVFIYKNQTFCLMWKYIPNWYDNGLTIIATNFVGILIIMDLYVVSFCMTKGPLMAYNKSLPYSITVFDVVKGYIVC